MELLHTVLPKLIAAILSVLDSVNLRNRVYSQQQRIEILETAIDDIARINGSKDPLIKGITDRVASK
jgi:hypothetical protein